MATITGNDNSNLLIGTNAGDVINANGGNDLILSGNGSDIVDAGAGNDIVLAGNGSDTVDGGSGCDLVSGGAGNDVLIYRVSENASSTDYYDGGAHFDTLRLELTGAEWLNPAVQADVAAYLAFIAANTLGNGTANHQVFSFTAFDLHVTKVEYLEVVVDGVVIDPTNPTDNPVVANDDVIATAEDDPSVAINLLANDSAPDQVASITVENPPANGSVQLTVDLSNPSSPVANAVYTPNAAYQSLAAGETATDTFTYRVTDADGDFQIATVTVTITGTNDAPTVSAEVTGAGAEASGTFSVDLLQNASDVDNGAVLHIDNVVWSELPGNMPAGFTLNGNAIEVDTDSPAYNAMAVGETFTVHFTYDVVDEHGATVAQTATVTITGANDAPTVSAEVTGGGAEGSGTLSVDLLQNASDVDNGAVLHIENVVWSEVPGNMPAGFTLNGNAIEVDTDSPAYNAMAAGETFTVHFTYGVVDEHGAVVAQTATVTITGTNDGPVAVADTSGGDAVVEAGVGPGNTPDAGDPSATGNVLANDTDADNGDSLTVTTTGVIQGVYGSLTLAADGSWTYTLDNADADTNALAESESAVDVFNYTVEDSQGATSSSTLTVNITGTNDQPDIAGTVAGAVEENVTSQATGQLNSGDPDHGAQDSWTVVGGTPAHAADYLFAIDNLTIVKNGNTIFEDDFNNGSAPPSSPNFSNGNPHSYGTTGTFTETGGRAIMDGTVSGPAIGVGTPDEFVGHFATVRSNIDPNDLAAGLKIDDDFTVEGRFDLILPDDGREAYGIRLTDRLQGGSGNPPDQPGDDAIELVVRRGVDGVVRVQLIETDFANDVRTIIQSRALNVGTNDQIVLRLEHDASNPGTVTAAFDLLTGGVVTDTVSFSAVGQIFGTETPGFTGDDEVWTRAQIVAYTPEEADSTLNGTYGSLVINQAGQWTYNLADGQANVQALAAGETVYDTFQVQVTDEHGAADTETVTIAVTGTNDAPTVSAEATGSGAEASGTFNVDLLQNASDVDNGAVLHIENVVWNEVPGDMPAGFTVNGSTIEVDTDSPAYDLMAVGETFTVHFTYDVVDEHGATTTQTAIITITGTNDGPVAVADTSGGDAVVEAGVAAGDPSASGNVLANDSDVDASDSLSVTTTGTFEGTYGSLSLAADGSWTYTLNDADPDTDALAEGETAADVFSYTIADSQGATSTSTLTVEITGSNDAPTITGGTTSGSVQENTAGQGQASGDLAVFDPDSGAILSWTAQGGTASADADFLFTADSLTIVKNGNPFFLDGFSDGNPPPSAPNFANGTAASYGGVGVNGLEEAGDRLIFDSDNAVLFDAPGAADPVIGVNGVLRSNIDPANMAAGLKSDDNFALSAVFDLILPDSPREAYGIHLTDRLLGGNGTPPDQVGDDVIELVVRQNLSGNVVVALREIDHVADVTTNIQSILLNAPAGADQIRLNMTHSTTDVGAVVASFEYLDDGVVVGSQTFSQVGRIFGTETPGDTSDDEVWTRAEITAYAPAQSDSVLSGTYGTLNINQAGTWNYVLDNSRTATQSLAEGETATETFTVQVTDEHGASDTETITINVAGSNDGPVMQTGPASRTTAEDSETPNLTETGLMQFSDLDLSDTHVVGASLQSAVLSSGGAVSAGLAAALNAAMTGSLFDPSAGDGHGELQWDFSLANSEVQFLNAGETLTATYDVGVTDENGATATQTVTINVTGENDGPVVLDFNSVASGTGLASYLEEGFTLTSIAAGDNVSFINYSGDSDVEVQQTGGASEAYRLQRTDGGSFDFDHLNVITPFGGTAWFAGSNGAFQGWSVASSLTDQIVTMSSAFDNVQWVDFYYDGVPGGGFYVDDIYVI